MTTIAPTAPSATRRSGLLITTRVLLVLFGTLKLSSTTFFVFLASAAEGGDPQGLGDWAVAVWSYVVATAYLVIAARLGRPDRRLLPVMAGLTAADVAFSLVKLFVYEETAGLVFMGMTLLLLGLVAAATRSRRA